MDEEKEKMKTGKKLVIALIMILLILTAGAYGYGVHYFTDHFLPGSQVNGFNCSYKTADETEKLLAKEVQAYVLTVDTRNNGKESITAKEAGLVYKPDGGAKKLIRKQDRYKWFLAFDQMNKLTSCVITYDFSDRSEQLDRNTIKDWLVRDANGDYIVNKDQVAAYVNSLGYKYDTFGCTRTFTTYDGRQKTIKGGDYGWAIDQTTETEWLYNAILAGTTEVRQPAYAYSGLCRDTNDIGNTYVEIDLTNQRMVFYKDGQLLVDTPVVTGCVRKGHSTPTGCFALDAMRSPAVLKGPGYASPVTYWMPFSGGVGIHDASWRSQYGGQIYITNGSHGCVNTPKDKAAIIYNNISVGVPIVVYE